MRSPILTRSFQHHAKAHARAADGKARGRCAVQALLALCVLVCAPTVRAARYRIVGYVGSNAAVSAITPGKLDAINYAFARVDPAGQLYFAKPDAAQATLAGLVQLRRRQPDLKIILSIGGWGADHFSDVALTDTLRKHMADAAAQLVERFDLDGIDIDWEYPTLPGAGIDHRPEDRRNFSLLLEALRARLDRLSPVHGGRHYLLTIAAADGEFVAGIELARVARSLDWINLMTYDFHTSLTPTTGHHAGLYRSILAPAGDRSGDHAVKQFLAAGVPASKLNLGVAFYGRAFADVVPAHQGLQQRYGRFDGAPPWRVLKADYLGRPGWTRHWDARAQAPTLWNAQTHGFVSYEDPASLRAKARYVRQHHLGGMMFWEYSLDDDEQLLDVLRAGLEDR